MAKYDRTFWTLIDAFPDVNVNGARKHQDLIVFPRGMFLMSRGRLNREMLQDTYQRIDVSDEIRESDRFVDFDDVVNAEIRRRLPFTIAIDLAGGEQLEVGLRWFHVMMSIEFGKSFQELLKEFRTPRPDA